MGNVILGVGKVLKAVEKYIYIEHVCSIYCGYKILIKHWLINHN